MHAYSNRCFIKVGVAVLLLILSMAFSKAACSRDNLSGNLTANTLENGWMLNTDASSLTFQTIKNGSNLETSHFRSFQGAVDKEGVASLRIQLDSVDTKVDLRNVRLRFLFFETYKFAEAVVSANINPGSLSTLAAQGRLKLPLNFVLNLHGVKRALQVDTVITQLASNQVSVASAAPVSIETTMFDLDEGLKKLEDSAKVSIVPMGSVSFNLIFDVLAVEFTPDPTTSASPAVNANINTEVNPDTSDVVLKAAPASTAVEASSAFSKEECSSRLEILSRTGAIYFKIGSANLDPNSIALPNCCYRCNRAVPPIQFGGFWTYRFSWKRKRQSDTVRITREQCGEISD